MSKATLKLDLVSTTDCETLSVEILDAVVAGWTGRNKAAMEKHIAELEAIGVPRPASTPIFYRVAATRLTTAPAIQVMGHDSSGEVEFVLTNIAGRLWVGVGSDHTDRVVETIGITLSKHMCEKPLASHMWPYDEVAGHWDRLVLRSHISEDGKRVPYQEGPVTTMLDPLELIKLYGTTTSLPEGILMFCGTLPAMGGIRPSSRFDFELWDPVLDRTIRHAYNVVCLPVAEKVEC
jgi:hypothetical protein